MVATNTGIDTADVATLNDALGSAGVDLRVLDYIRRWRSLADRLPRLRKKACTGHMILINRIVLSKTGLGNNLRPPILTYGS